MTKFTKRRSRSDGVLFEIDRLAKYFMKEYPHEICEGSAVDNAIAYIERLKRELCAGRTPEA